MYKSELSKLKSLVSEDSWRLFEQAGVILAGGAITSVFTNKDVNDLDVYFKSEEQLVRTIAAVFGMDDFQDHDVEPFTFVYNGTSQRTLMLKDGKEDRPIQFMTFKYFENATDIFDTFDFTCCMGAYDFEKGSFFFHDDFFKHNAQRYLKFNPGTDYPLMSLLRVDKYRQKGYSISKSELIRVITTCMDLNIDSWEGVKEHIGGMYGYCLDDVFDESRNFSLNEVCDQLDTLEEKDIQQWKPENFECDFYSLCEKFCSFPDDLKEETPGFDDSKYLYKCVNGNWESPIWANKLKYVEGARLSSQEHGEIFFHGSSEKPYHTSRYWVEAELVDGEVKEHPFNRQKSVVNGTVRINRCFEYNPLNNAYHNYIEEKYMLKEDT